MVGNNVAVPTLKQHGLAVAAVPSVLFSNTPHYPSVHGGAMPTEWFEGYLDDLEQRGALQHLRAVLIGYLGHPDQIAALANWLDRLQRNLPDLQVIVDPVIGDHDVGTYVNPDLIDAYRHTLLPLATGLTPNGYELAQLTGMPVHREDDVRKAARTLLNERTRWVAVTSSTPDIRPDEQMGITIVTAEDAVTIHHPKIDCHCKGTGDLFAANLTAHLLKNIDLQQTTMQAASHVLNVLKHTHASGCEEMVLPS